jgi:hypothetical protein
MLDRQNAVFIQHTRVKLTGGIFHRHPEKAKHTRMPPRACVIVCDFLHVWKARSLGPGLGPEVYRGFTTRRLHASAYTEIVLLLLRILFHNVLRTGDAHFDTQGEIQEDFKKWLKDKSPLSKMEDYQTSSPFRSYPKFEDILSIETRHGTTSDDYNPGCRHHWRR